jgi:putative tryptophan/tyrosine transport system substrate-binding protein
MRRREFIAFAVTTAARPFVVRAQPALPVVGFLDPTSLDKYRPFVEAFRKGLHEVGFTEDHNVAIEYHWAEGQYARLPELAVELVQHKVAVIVATGITAARAAKAATSTIPIVFNTGGDPVKFDLVTSFSKPGQNVTGVASLGKILVAKQLEVLHELRPRCYPLKRISGVAAPSRRDDPSIRRFHRNNALSSSCPCLADAGSCPGNCPGMEEATGAPSSFAV